jgi:hypothetical protein
MLKAICAWMFRPRPAHIIEENTSAIWALEEKHILVADWTTSIGI